MGIVGGMDVHRRQITFDYADQETGEVTTGRIVPATRQALAGWLGRFHGVDGVRFAFEGCTGWRFVAEELLGAGIEPHMAEPADTALLRGGKKRAKTDRADARLLRVLLAEGRLPESWIPPTHVIEVRVLGRTYERLLSDRREWKQRVHAQLFQQGVPPVRGLFTPEGRDQLRSVLLSPAGRRLVEISLRVIDALDAEMDSLRAELAGWAGRQPACQALRQGLWGVGPLLAPIIWAEMGDTRRFGSSRKAVRNTGLDITVYETDGHRAPGHLSRQGPSTLRWALVEAAQHASKRSSPHHAYYRQVAQRLGGSRAALSVARKLARQAHHILVELGDLAWAPS